MLPFLVYGIYIVYSSVNRLMMIRYSSDNFINQWLGTFNIVKESVGSHFDASCHAQNVCMHAHTGGRQQQVHHGSRHDRGHFPENV